MFCLSSFLSVNFYDGRFSFHLLSGLMTCRSAVHKNVWSQILTVYIRLLATFFNSWILRVIPSIWYTSSSHKDFFLSTTQTIQELFAVILKFQQKPPHRFQFWNCVCEWWIIKKSCKLARNKIVILACQLTLYRSNGSVKCGAHRVKKVFPSMLHYVVVKSELFVFE